MILAVAPRLVFAIGVGAVAESVHVPAEMQQRGVGSMIDERAQATADPA